MGKASKRSGPRGPKNEVGRQPLGEDMYDEVDRFHKDNDLRFETEFDEDDDGDEEGEDEEGVMDLDDSDEADSDDDLQAGGQLAKIIAAERAVKEKLALHKAGAADSEGESESEDDDENWGGKKRAYYGDEEVDVDFESDEEAAQEEEEEALRLQKAQAAKLSKAQFGLPEDVSEEEDDDDDDTQADKDTTGKMRTLGDAAEALKNVDSETVAKALTGPAQAQIRAAVLADAPELLTLLPDLVASLGEVRHRTAPLLAELRATPDLATKDGLSYLDAKHMLLLMYCIHIVFYILLKLEGQPVRSHPVMQRLVAAKTYLEKLKAVDKRMKHQVDKLLAAAKAARTNTGHHGEDGDLMHRANPSALVSKLEEDIGGSGAYRPPKLAAVAMDAPGGAMQVDSDEELLAQAAGTTTTHSVELSGKKRSREERSAQRMQKAAMRRAQNSQFVKDLQAEIYDAPEEDAAVGAAAARGTDTMALLKQQQRLEARAAIEEDMMIRVALPKEEKKRLRAARRAAQAAGAAVEGFADDVEGLIAQENNAGVAAYTDKLRLGQKFGGALTSDVHTQPGGDSELPMKPALPERRAKYDAVKARQAAQAAHAEAEALAARPPRVEDEFYSETKMRQAEKKKAKEEARRGPAPLPPLADPHDPTSARGVTREIKKNRGLTPHKKKEMRNPRKANRIKFASAEKRRKGAVVSVRKSDGPYGGEATGIKSKIVKSVRLG